MASTIPGPGPSAAAPVFGARLPAAWRADCLAEGAGYHVIPGDALAELGEVTRYLRANPLPTLALRPDDFELDAVAAFAGTVRTEVASGLGFALIDRLPLDAWSGEEAVTAYWLLSHCIARPVAQSWEGRMIYDVRDLGRPPGNGVRPDVTNVGQNFHTDNSYNLAPPHVVSLLCLQTARCGGESGVISFAWARAEMKRRHPQLYPRLFEPYWFDRQREHAPDDAMVTSHPLFERIDGGIVGRLSLRQVVNGHRLAGIEIDARGCQALEAFEAILNEPGAAKTFRFEPGQMQYLNNLALGHRRTGFDDWDEHGRRRHLVRLWLRDEGGRGYHG